MITLTQMRRLVNESRQYAPIQTTPLWMVAKNCGVPMEEMAGILQDAGIEVVVDGDLKPAVRKTDLLAHMTRNVSPSLVGDREV